MLTEIEEADAWYNASDTLAMCRMMPHIWAELTRVGAEQVYAYDELMADLALQMTRIGMPVNIARREEIGQRLYALRDQAIEELTPFTEGEYREPFLDWVASFFAKTARNGEPKGGTVRVGPSAAAAQLEEAQRRRTAWKAYRKELLASEVPGAQVVVDSSDPSQVGRTLLEDSDAQLATCELAVKAAKQAVKVAQYVTDEEDGLPHTDETAFALRCKIRRAEAELAISKKGVNYGAKVQQAAILRAAGVPLHRTTEKSGLPKIDKELLKAYSRHTAARALLSYILTTSTINVYIEGEKRAGKTKGAAKPVVIGEDGYLHPNWTVHKITGRWGSNPNCFDGDTQLRWRWLGDEGVGAFDRIAELCAFWASGARFEVAQYNPQTGDIEFAQPETIFCRLHEGLMYRWRGPTVDLCVTEDHRLLLANVVSTSDKERRGPVEYETAHLIGTFDATAGRLWAMRSAHNPCYMLAFDAWNARAAPVSQMICTRLDWSGPVYCLTVPSSYVLTYRNGKLCVAGQCQNWSKRAGGGAENLRSMIEAPDGYLLVGADQKQLEARLIGAMSGCKLMIDCFRKGDDIHGLFAGVGFPNEWPRLAKIFKEHKAAAGGKCKCADCETRNKMRDRVKNLEYGGFYGGKEDALFAAIAKDFPDATLGQVREFLLRFNAMLPEVLAWREQTLKEAIQDGEIRSPILGRRQVFPLGRVDPNVAYNYKAQAGGADLWAIGAGKFMQKWDQWAFDARIIHNGHDSVLILCREELAAEVEQDVYACWNMEWNGVPFEMECQAAKQWSET